MFHIYGPHGPTLLSNGRKYTVNSHMSLANNPQLHPSQSRAAGSLIASTRSRTTTSSTSTPRRRLARNGRSISSISTTGLSSPPLAQRKSHSTPFNNEPPANHLNRYMGGSIPGKIYEPVCYSGGIPAYKIEIREALDTMKGFEIVKNK
jgi:hypothetical protein